MSLAPNIFRFGNFTLDTGERVLFENGKPVPITPKALQLLSVLVESHGRIVDKENLLNEVWPDSFVEESNLTFNIRQIRKILGDRKDNSLFIETVPRRGYRFVASVEECRAGEIQNGTNASRVVTNGLEQAGYRYRHSRQNAQSIYTAEAENGNPGPVNTDLHSKTDTGASTRGWRILGVPAVLALLLTATLGGFYIWHRDGRTMADRLQSLKVEKLTDTGNASGTNISPDGNWIAYSTVEGGRHIIWLRQLATGTTTQILSLENEAVHGVAFSRDGQYLLYHHSSGDGVADLSRIPLLGGNPTTIVAGTHGGTDFSPDGSKIAFIRFKEGASLVMLANSDGSDERTLLTGPKGRSIIDVAWSPDGDRIAYCVGKYPSRERDFEIFEYRLADGSRRPLTEFKWNYLENVLWLPDQSGLLTDGRDSADGTNQIWLVPLSGGAVRQMSFNSSSLSLRGASADMSKIIASEDVQKSRIWVGPASDFSAARPFSAVQWDLEWTSDGRIVFPANDAKGTDLWISKPDGTDRRQLTSTESSERSPAVSPDGRFVAYVANLRGQQHIWRIDIDGGNPAQLTNGEGEHYPAFTADGRFVIYNSLADGSLWKVSINGGLPERVFAERAMRVSVSPDGSSFAYFGRKESQRKIFVRKFADGSILGEYATLGRFASPSRIAWSDNGKSLLYIAMDRVGVGNLYRQRLGNFHPERLTEFNSDQIFDFAFSVDGGQIALVRGDWYHDALLLTGLE